MTKFVPVDPQYRRTYDFTPVISTACLTVYLVSMAVHLPMKFITYHYKQESR